MCISMRLKQICEHKGWKIKEFAEQTGLPYRTLQGYMGGEREPNAEGMTAFAKVGINLNWLATGNGKMLIESLPDTLLTQDEKELLTHYQHCNSLGKKAILLSSQAISYSQDFTL